MNVEYRTIEGYPHYRVGDDGSVLSCLKKGKQRKSWPSDEWKRIRPSPDGGGYLTVVLYRDGEAKTFRIHRLVLLAFVGPCPDGMEACHDNGDAADCSRGNLRWDTHANNNRDRGAHGTQPRGETHGMASITKIQADEIRQLRSGGMQCTSIAKRMGISVNVVYGVAQGRTFVT